MLKSISLPILASATALGLLSPLASRDAAADIVTTPGETLSITSCHITGDTCTETTFGTVALTNIVSGGVTTGVDVKITLAAGEVFANSGDGGILAFDSSTAPTGVTLDSGTTIGGTPPNPTPILALATNVNADGFTPMTTFQHGVACTNCGPGTASNANNAQLQSPIEFDLAGISISSFTPLNNGVLFAIDIGNPCGGTTGQTCTPGNTSGFNTGWVDVSVPAPLIGHGLLALLAIGGVLFGGRLLESLKKHQLQQAA